MRTGIYNTGFRLRTPDSAG